MLGWQIQWQATGSGWICLCNSGRRFMRPGDQDRHGDVGEVIVFRVLLILK